MYKKIIPSSLTLQFIIDNSVRNFAEKPAISFVEGSPITYKELGDEINKFSSLLYSFGLQAGDKVALFTQLGGCILCNSSKRFGGSTYIARLQFGRSRKCDFALRS